MHHFFYKVLCGRVYQDACAWHAGSEVYLETRKVPPPLLLPHTPVPP